MGKDQVALLRRFIADEEDARREGREGELWGRERTRIAPLVKIAWKELSWKEAEALYGHLLRRTRRLPVVGNVGFGSLRSAYMAVDPDWDRIGFLFRFGCDPRGTLPSSVVEDFGAFERRDHLIARILGFPSLEKLFGRAPRFLKDGAEYGQIALEAMRYCGYSETKDPDELPESQTFFGLLLVAMLHPTAGKDAMDEVSSFSAFNAAPVLKANVEAAWAAARQYGA